MRVLFAGTPEFAARHLDALVQAGQEVVAVLTQPDRPAGRGQRVEASPVKNRAWQAGIPVYQPEHLKSSEVRELIRTLAPDLMVVVAYGLLLPEAILQLPPLGAVNVHASLLPRWRGAAPIQRAIQAGDLETGVCIMQMEAGLDTGPVLAERRCPIGQDDTTGLLQDRLAVLGMEALLEVLDILERGRCLSARPQPAEGITYAHKISREDSMMNWQESADFLERSIRAFTPSPVSRTLWNRQPLKVWAAEVDKGALGTARPGTIQSVEEDGIVVVCGEGLLRLTRLQKAGGKPLSVREFLRGHPLRAGERLGA